jgi:hypothetical protein
MTIGTPVVKRWSPTTTFLRTVLSGLAGYALAWAAIDWATDWKAGATIIALNVAAVLVAGVIALAVAARDNAAKTPFGKGVYQFLQLMLTAIGLVVINTFADLTNLGHLAIIAVPGALFSALGTWLQNELEARDLIAAGQLKAGESGSVLITVLVILALLVAGAALFGGHVGSITALKLVAASAVLICIALLIPER